MLTNNSTTKSTNTTSILISHKPNPYNLSKTHLTNLKDHWSRGQDYSSDIISTLNHHQSGWVDWNLCLDENGGPNWANNKCDSPVIVSSDVENCNSASEFL